MKLLIFLTLLVGYVFGQTIIDEDIFDIFFEEGFGAIVVEIVGNATNCSNVTVCSANVTFVSRTVANNTLVDEYEVSCPREGIIGTARRILSATIIPSPFAFVVLLEIRFEIDLTGPPALLVGPSEDPFRILEVRFVALDSEPSSSVESIFSPRSGIEWIIVPQFYPALTRQNDFNFVDDRTPLHLLIVGNGRSHFEISFQAILPPQSPLIDPCDPRVVIRETTPFVDEIIEEEIEEVVEDVLPTDEEEEIEEEEEEIITLLNLVDRKAAVDSGATKAKALFAVAEDGQENKVNGGSIYSERRR